MNKETKEHLLPYALYLKEQGKTDESIVEEISGAYNLTPEEAREIVECVKDSFPREIKAASSLRIYYLVPTFLISTVIFVGWIMISVTLNWVFFVFGIYGVVSGLLLLVSGLSIDRILKENFSRLRLKLRISFAILFLLVLLGYPLYRLTSKKYVLTESDFVVFSKMALTEKPDIKYENKIASAANLHFSYYDEIFELAGSEFKATAYGDLIKLNAGDTMDIYLERNPKTNGYYKSFFSKNIGVYNILKDKKLLVNLQDRNAFEKGKLEKTIWTCLLFSIPFFSFLFLQIKLLKKSNTH